jgi:methylamine dehydrogenase heavy chain
VLVAFSVASRAQLPPERGSVRALPATTSPHWVWVNDIAFHHMESGKAYLVDGDSGRFLGMLSTGYGFSALAIPRDYHALYAPETYFARGTRGARTDVITVYDPRSLSPAGEVIIPPRRVQAMPNLAQAALTDDDRFLIVYNFSPAQSVSVVDMQTLRLAQEIDTAGCALVYPGGRRTFHMLCGDGALLTVRIDDRGELVDKQRSEPFFDVAESFVTEKAVRYRNQWLFVSWDGYVYPVKVADGAPQFDARWPLLRADEQQDEWKIGGLQHLAVHQASGRLFSLMHQGGAGTHKDPGTQVWVYDLASQRSIQRIALRNPASSIQVSQDDAPLLFATFMGSPALDIYDAGSGEYRRSVPELGLTPTVLQTPVSGR